MKSLNEQVQEILASKQSQSAKRVELAKIGLTNIDITRLFQIEKAKQPRTERSVSIANILAKYTFGVEIECYNAPRTALLDAARRNNLAMQSERYNHTDNRHYYKLVSDASISGNDPVECVTPILKGSKSGFDSLKTACKVLNEVGAKVNKSTGLHVHVGGSITEKQYINTFINYYYLENVIDTFMAASRKNARYAAALHNVININDLVNAQTYADIRRAFHCSRYYKINCESFARHHTIEFRQHSGTTNYDKIANWAKFCIKLVEWSANNRLTTEIASINDIPFLTATEKRYFTQHANDLARVNE